jgi:exopolysaccharide biosynthesis operon protein EpsL
MRQQSTRHAAKGCGRLDVSRSRSRRELKRARASIAVLGLALCAKVAWGDAADTVRPYAEFTYTHSSNLFRLSNESEAQAQLGTPEMSDNARRIETGVRLRAELSRQVVLFSANVNRTHYERFGSLDYSGNALDFQWAWEAGKQWSGDLRYDTVRTLSSFTELHAPVKDLVVEKRPLVDAYYLLYPRWRIGAAAVGTEVEHGAPSRQDLDRREHGGRVELQYLGAEPQRDVIAAQWVASDLHYRKQQLVDAVPVDSDHRRNLMGARFDWPLTGKSRLQGGLGVEQLRFHEVKQRDYSGPYSRLTWNWSATGHTTLEAGLWQETVNVDDARLNYALSRGASVSSIWQPTAKMRIQVRLAYESLEYRGENGLLSGSLPLRQDRVRSEAIVLTHEVSRALRIELAYRSEKRVSNRALTDYRDNTWLLSLRGEI